jgi:hypothetical protein
VRARAQPPHGGAADVAVAISHTRQHDHLAVARGGGQHRPHALQPRRVGVAQRVVQDQRGAAVVDQRAARQRRQDPQLLLGAAGQLMPRHRLALQGAPGHGQPVVELDSERVVVDQPAQALDGLRQRLAVGLLGAGALLGHDVEQQLGGVGVAPLAVAINAGALELGVHLGQLLPQALFAMGAQPRAHLGALGIELLALSVDVAQLALEVVGQQLDLLGVGLVELGLGLLAGLFGGAALALVLVALDDQGVVGLLTAGPLQLVAARGELLVGAVAFGLGGDAVLAGGAQARFELGDGGAGLLGGAVGLLDGGVGLAASRLGLVDGGRQRLIGGPRRRLALHPGGQLLDLAG